MRHIITSTLLTLALWGCDPGSVEGGFGDQEEAVEALTATAALTNNATGISKVSGVNDYIRTSSYSGSGYGAGASSTQNIVLGDAAVEAKVAPNQTSVAFGLSGADTNDTLEEIDFGFAIDGAVANIVENGLTPSGAPTLAVVPEDTLRISLEGTVVKYYQNGVLRFTSAAPIAYPYVFDSAFGPTGTILHAPMISYLKPTTASLTTNKAYETAKLSSAAEIDEYKVQIRSGQTELWLRYEGAQLATASVGQLGGHEQVPAFTNFAMNIPGTGTRYVYVRVGAKPGANPVNEPYKLYISAPPTSIATTPKKTDTSILDMAETLVEGQSSVGLQTIVKDAFDRVVTFPLSPTLRVVYGPSLSTSTTIQTKGTTTTTLSLPSCFPGLKNIQVTKTSGSRAGIHSINYNAREPDTSSLQWPRLEASLPGATGNALFAHICKETRVGPIPTAAIGNAERTGTVVGFETNLITLTVPKGQQTLWVYLDGDVRGTATFTSTGAVTTLAPRVKNVVALPNATETGRTVELAIKAVSPSDTSSAPFIIYMTNPPVRMSVTGTSQAGLISTMPPGTSLVAKAATVLAVGGTLYDAANVVAVWPARMTLAVATGIEPTTTQTQVAVGGRFSYDFPLENCYPGLLNATVTYNNQLWNINYNANQGGWPMFWGTTPDFPSTAASNFAHICKESLY